ncbi:MAG: helix-turn-helix domain-containing protein [Saprospirales bacterium]|nr:helix-turn-helix domain-containing protein [Saprospirales bacterium]
MQKIVITTPEELITFFTQILRAELAEHSPRPAEPFSEFPELLSRRQVAELLGVSLATVDNWTKEERLLKHRIGPVVRFRKDEVLAALTSLQKFQRAGSLFQTQN